MDFLKYGQIWTIQKPLTNLECELI
jgi:hypothetical protein